MRHKKEQAAMRLKLGLGKDAADLVFTTAEGEVINPDVLSEMFRIRVHAAGIKHTRFHGLRPTFTSRTFSRAACRCTLSLRAPDMREPRSP